MTTTDEQAIEATVLDYFDRGARLATLAAWLVLLATASDSMEMPGVAVAVLVGYVVRDILRPEHDVVRATPATPGLLTI